MKTLTEHNSAKGFKPYDRINQPCGVKCDKCPAEMVYTDNNMLCSFPAVTAVHCPKCEHTGYMK